MQPSDWLAVREIYAEGIATGQATFETLLPDWEKWDSSHRQDCRLVGRGGGRVVGWAALSPVSARRVYSGVAEVSVYVAAVARGHGLGTILLKALIEESERCGVWTLQAGIFPESAASIAIHKSCGFHEVGKRQRIGKLGETWRDVLLLERRSTAVGI
ncbi:MAG: N-acetyltransferase family protein [Candidatus Sulfotelmatobacter sp.]